MNGKLTIPLISVIVPIYNIEKYLKRCVDSILNQSYSNIEIILVDDGSMDDSGVICDDYKKRDYRIKVIHKVNGGLSDARNVGIDIATGEYITCIDSDDFVSTFYLENLLRALQEGDADISTSWFIDYFEGDSIPEAIQVRKQEIEVLDIESFYKKMLLQDGVEVCAWGKLYKRDLFQNIRYPVGKLYEDIPTIYKLVEKAKKIAVIPSVDYYYFQRENSIALAKFSIRKMDAINHMEQFKEFIAENYPNLKEAAECRYFSTLCNILFQIRDSQFEKQKSLLWNEVKKYRKGVLRYKEGRKKARLAALISYGGYRALRFTYSIKNIWR